MRVETKILFTLLCLVFYFNVEINTKSIEIEFKRTTTKRILKQKQEFRFLQNNSNIGKNDIALEYEDDENYFVVDLGLGTPQQVFSVQIDTTTSETWVPSLSVNDSDLVRFNASNSSTIRMTNKTIEIEDEDGDVEGNAAFDTLTIGNLNAKGFGFVLVNEYDDDYDDHEEGKLGLGYTNEHKKDFSFIDHLKNTGAIDKRIFSISELNDTHGVLHIGDFPDDFDEDDEGYTYCNLTNTDDLDDEYVDGWVCNISHVLTGDYNQNFTQAEEVGGRVIFDSGYGYISVPDDYLDYFVDSLKNVGLDLNKCNKEKDDDKISFTCPQNVLSTVILQDNHVGFLIQGYSYQIALEDLFEDNDDYNSTDTSEFLIVFNKEDEDIWTLGYPFFSQYTVVFNKEADQVGFYGGDTQNYYDEWTAYQQAFYNSEDKRFYYLILGASILGGVLLLFIIFLIVHSIKRRKLDQHGPLINERN